MDWLILDRISTVPLASQPRFTAAMGSVPTSELCSGLCPQVGPRQ